MKQTILKTMLLVLALAFSTQSNAQFFNYLSDSSSDFTTAQLLKIDSLRENPLYDSIMIVEVGDFWSLQDSGRMTFNLPNSEYTNAKAWRVQVPDIEAPDDEFVWDGFFLGPHEDENGDPEASFDGAIHLMKKDGEIYGTFKPFEADVYYNLISLAPGKNALIKYNMTEYFDKSVKCTASQDSTPSAKSTSTGPCDPVRVLVLVTERAQAAVGNYMHEVNQAMNMLDGATYNSLDGANANTKFVLAGVQQISPSQFSPGGTNIKNDAYSLANNIYAQSYRNTYKADVVICLTDNNYSDLVGHTADIGPNDALAYVILEADHMNVGYAFSHEIGHLMGARHQQSSVSNLTYHDNTAGYDHGYQIKTGMSYSWRRYIDIMHENYNGANRDHIFSTPNKSWRGKTYGTSDNNAAQTFLDNHCTVSEFRTDATQMFDATITATSGKSTGETVYLTGNPIAGIAGYNFRWYLSNNGGYWFTHLYTQNTVPYSTTSFIMPHVPMVIVQLQATDGVGLTRFVNKTIWNMHPDFQQIVRYPGTVFKSGVTSVSNIATNKSFELSPNPAKTNVTLNFNGIEGSKDVALLIVDVFGKEVQKASFNTKKKQQDLDVSSLSAGTYFVKMQGENINFTQKLTIIK